MYEIKNDNFALIIWTIVEIDIKKYDQIKSTQRLKTRLLLCILYLL